MANSYHHAVSSARRFGGTPQDYQPIHDFLDSTKAAWADPRHRAILHNTFGCFLVEKIFGHTLRLSDGKQIPTRLIAEQHLREDTGHVPSIQDWLDRIPLKDWMLRGARRLSQELDDETQSSEPVTSAEITQPPTFEFFWSGPVGALQPIPVGDKPGRLTVSRRLFDHSTEWFSGEFTAFSLFNLLRPVLVRKRDC